MTMQQNITPDCHALFFGFFKLGLMGFGGVLPIAHHVIVEEKHWLDQNQFTNLLGVCQILPGGNIVNMSVAIGMQFQGVKGAICALLGLITVPTIFVVSCYQFYEQFKDILWVQHLMLGLAASAAGLLFATAFKMLKPLLKNYLMPITLGLTFIFTLWIKLPLIMTLSLLFIINLIFLRIKPL